MDLRNYPLDRQRCKIEMEVYTYDTSVLRMQWRSESPMELPHKLFLSSFALTSTYLQNCANVYTSGTVVPETKVESTQNRTKPLDAHGIFTQVDTPAYAQCSH